MSRKFMSLRGEILEKGLVKSQSTEEYSPMLLTLPVPKEKISKCASRRISPAHVGNLKNSIDFYVPQGTPVCAAADGIVFGIKDDSKIGGPNVKFWADGNYVEIKHGNEFRGILFRRYEHLTNILTKYEHLMYKGIVVEIGQEIKSGQIIGYSGNTGISEAPHLHFELFMTFGEGPDDYVTLKARFKNFPDIYKIKQTSLSKFLANH